jgi:hypothetical protein
MNPMTNREIDEALAERRLLPQPAGGRERAFVRRMLCARLVSILDELGGSGRTTTEWERMADDVLLGSGITPHGKWLYNLRNNRRLPDRHEVRALAVVLGENPSRLDAHLAVAPWALEDFRRAPLARRRRQLKYPSGLAQA